jgi:copper resistance protein D
MAEALAAIRFVHFLAAMAAWGIAAFRLYAFADAAIPRDAPARAALDTMLSRGTAASTALALVSGLAIVPLIAAQMTDLPAAALDPAIARTVLTDTGFGHAWCWHLGFAALLLLICTLPPPPRPYATAALAALLLTSLAWVGHAADGGPLHEINQMLHLAAAGLWLGGLVPLSILLGRAARPEGATYVPLARAALPLFSQIGYVAVALVALTGAVNSWLLVGSLHALVATPYGGLLAVKMALFAAMVATALVNRFRLLPRLRDPAMTANALRSLYVSVIGEQALGLAILAVVAVLGTWPPAVEASHHVRDANQARVYLSDDANSD